MEQGAIRTGIRRTLPKETPRPPVKTPIKKKESPPPPVSRPRDPKVPTKQGKNP